MLHLESLPKDAPFLAGVSGGYDSVSLLEHLLREGFSALVVCHLNHQLRGAESDADEQFVLLLAQKHGLLCETARTDVASTAKLERLSLEAAGRRARHRFFENCARKHQAAGLFLAHHADDQAETILLHLLRGTGLAGLGGMAETSTLGSLPVYRPFLTRRKRDLPAPSAFREDSSNLASGFLRNRLRHGVFPALESALQHDPKPALLRLGEIAAREDEFLDDLAAEAFHCVLEGACLKTPSLKKLHPALQRRVVHRWLSTQGIPDFGFQEIEAVRSLALHPGAGFPARINLPGNHQVHRREKRLWITLPSTPAREASRPLEEA